MLVAAPYVLEKFPDQSNIYHQRALQTLELFSRAPALGNNCQSLKGLKNISQSCYLDSVLLTLFAVPNKFVTDNILNANLQVREGPSFDCAENKGELQVAQQTDLTNRKRVQEQFRNMTESIRNTGDVKYCTDLRSVLVNCSNAEQYHKGGEKDAGEFLGYILSMFDTNVARKEVVTYITNDLGLNPNLIEVSKRIDPVASIIQFVDSFTLEKKKKHFISEFLSKVMDSGEMSKNNRFKYNDQFYSRRIAKETLLSTPYLVFNIQRLHPVKNQRLHTPIVPTDTLTIADGQRFQLSAIVVYLQGHYVAFLKCGNDWYYYNDLREQITLVGSYDQLLLRKKPSPFTDGTLYYYVPVKLFSSRKDK